MRRLGVVLGLVVLVLSPGLAAQAAPAVSEQDTRFLQAAHESNLAEIAVGQLAESKAVSQQVTDLGAMFVTDHTSLDKGLQATASTLGVSLPDTPNPAQQAVQGQLEAASGPRFDELFISTQLDAHARAMALGETEVAQGSDPSAKRVALDAAPTIAAHHHALQQAARELGLAESEVPSSIESGTGGQVARTTASGAAALVGACLLAVTSVVVVYARRRRRRTEPQ